MDNKKLFIVSLIISISIMMSIHSKAIAEYAFNFPEVPKESEEAAALLFDTLALTFQSLEELERGRLYSVRKKKYQIKHNLDMVLKRQKIIKEKTSKKKINVGVIPPDQLIKIRRDFERNQIKFPVYRNELPAIAIQQIESFSKFIDSFKFGENPTQNRKYIRLMINEIWRIVVIGVNVSEIAASLDK